MTDQAEGHGYELAVPYVTVTARGGPHDTTAYVAGWAMGALDVQLASPITESPRVELVREDSRAQADLIAMARGWLVSFTDYGDGWLRAEFTRTGAAP